MRSELEGDAVKREILTALDYSHLHDDWVRPLAETLSGISASDAALSPGPGCKSIWEIVLHLAVWTDNIVLRMRSGEDVYPEEGSWPAIPEARDEVAWERSKQRLFDSLVGLRAYLESAPPDALLGGPYGLADLLCRLIHNGYHIGQIVKMREMRGV